MVEGFFAIRSMKYNFKIWLSKKAMILMVPYFLWVIISFIVSNLDNGDIVKKYYLSIFLNQVNLWISDRINKYVPILNGSWNKR